MSRSDIPEDIQGLYDKLTSGPTRKDVVFLDMAIELGKLGTCDRKKVGAIITIDGRAVSWGYNGAPPGLQHCDENGHGWAGQEHLQGDFWDVQAVRMESASASRWREQMLRRHGCRNVTHAEANAVAFAARQGTRTEGGTCYVVVSPCANCARLLVAAGIVRVVWAETYRDPAGSELLEAAGVEKVLILPGDRDILERRYVG